MSQLHPILKHSAKKNLGLTVKITFTLAKTTLFLHVHAAGRILEALISGPLYIHPALKKKQDDRSWTHTTFRSDRSPIPIICSNQVYLNSFSQRAVSDHIWCHNIAVRTRNAPTQTWDNNLKCIINWSRLILHVVEKRKSIDVLNYFTDLCIWIILCKSYQ